MASLAQLSVRNFRNLARVEMDFPAAGIAVIGENGQGKTNLLEAMYYFHLLRSSRGARDPELVHFDASAFHITARIVTDRTHTASAAFERRERKKKIVIDGAEVTRVSDALGSLPSVLVSPRDVELVTGGPGQRRRFLDVVLALTSRRYLAALQSYRAALLRRNAALRAIARTGRSVETVAIWEPTLAEHGAVLLAERIRWVQRHADELARLCHAIGEREPVTARYATEIEDISHDTLLHMLERQRPLDIKRGATQRGPHRDDLSLTLGGRDVRLFGSAGQQRTIAIALRMLEAATLREHIGSEPLLLLDDPFAELDMRRSAHILALLRNAGMGQSVLAVPRPSDIPPELTTLERWCVNAGVLSRAPARVSA